MLIPSSAAYRKLFLSLWRILVVVLTNAVMLGILLQTVK